MFANLTKAEARYAARWAATVLWYATLQRNKGFIGEEIYQRCVSVWAAWPEMNDD